MTDLDSQLLEAHRRACGDHDVSANRCPVWNGIRAGNRVEVRSCDEQCSCGQWATRVEDDRDAQLVAARTRIAALERLVGELLAVVVDDAKYANTRVVKRVNDLIARARAALNGGGG